jgi:hypothetical protein
MRRTLAILLTLTLILTSASFATALESRRILDHSEEGAFLLNEHRTGEPELPAEEWQRDDVLWHRNQSGIFYSTAIGDNSAVFAGSFNEQAMHALLGDGTPLWTVSDGDVFGVAGAKSADLFASATKNESIAGATIRVWNSESSTPLWSKDIPACTVPDECISISDDGALLVLGLNMASMMPRLYTFDAPTGDLVSSYDCNANTSIRALEISDDGSLAAVRASVDVHVVETDTGTSRWIGNAGASSDGLAFAGDGSFIASGWTFLMVWEWTGATYQFRWSNNGGGTGWYLGRCAMSSSGDALMAAFYSTSYNQLKVMWFNPDNSAPTWIYESPLSNGVYQEYPVAIDMASAGQFAVVGSWGDAGSVNPEIHVFGPASSDPIYTVDSPGSIFSVAIRDDNGGIVGCGAGKNVHANEFGSGGDLYAFEVGPPTGLPGDTPEAQAKITAFPNPFNPKVTIELALPTSGLLALDIFSADGRKLRELARGEYPAGLRIFEWDGKDTAGHELPSGVYLARAKTADGESTERLVMLR